MRAFHVIAETHALQFDALYNFTEKKTSKRDTLVYIKLWLRM